jgi:hypothetical protein
MLLEKLEQMQFHTGAQGKAMIRYEFGELSFFNELK